MSKANIFEIYIGGDTMPLFVPYPCSEKEFYEKGFTTSVYDTRRCGEISHSSVRWNYEFSVLGLPRVRTPCPVLFVFAILE